MRICRAAFAAATSADAPGAAGSVTTTRVYRFCTVLIASDIATCTMAKVRSLGLLPTSLATRALAITFQSVMTSARADAANSAAATMPGSKAADELKPDFIGRLLYLPGSDMTARTKARRSNGSRSSPGIPGRMYWIVMMLPLIAAPLARRRSSDQPDQEDRNALGPDVGRSSTPGAG